MSESKVINLDMCPINSAVDGLRRANTHEVRGCVAATIDREGIYSYGMCDMTAEQMLAAAEGIRYEALGIIAERSEEQD